MGKKINKNKILVPTMGIAGVLVGTIPFISGCTVYIGGGDTPEPEPISNILTDKSTTVTEFDPNDFTPSGSFSMGSFELADSSAEWPSDLNSFTFKISVIGGPELAYLSGDGQPHWKAYGQQRAIAFYLSEETRNAFEFDRPYSIQMEIKYKDEVWYKNNGDGSGGTKQFTFNRVGEKEILIKNNTALADRTFIIDGDSDDSGDDLGDFALDSTILYPAPGMFTISLSIVGWQQIRFDEFGRHPTNFKNDFADLNHDTINFYLGAGAWGTISSQWQTGEKHPLSITVVDKLGTLYYKNTGADLSKAFYIQRI